MNLTLEQVRELAAMDRAMDSGTQPFVVCRQGRRWAFNADVMAACGCVSGQTTGDAVIIALMTENLRRLTETISANAAAAAIEHASAGSRHI